jgi:hypothetical protein
MSHKTAYLWGPLSSFSAPLAAWLLNKGWHIHIATKSSLNLLTLSSLELASAAHDLLVDALGGLERFRMFQDRVRFLDQSEPPRDAKYDAVIFCGLPPNFDEPRVPRAPWAVSELPKIAKVLKGVPIFVVSSLWGAIQKDRVVPEELEFERRKATSHWERICQRYEQRMIDALSNIESNWYFVRVPMLAGATTNGAPFNFTGPSTVFRELDPQSRKGAADSEQLVNGSNKIFELDLAYNPDSIFWFLPVDVAVYMFWRFLEDEVRPRICNLVSTQATLNREWINHFAQALGFAEVVQTERDSLNLPSVLRKLLVEDIQVRTRNLFELSSRYQLTPVKLDAAYFEKIIHEGRKKRWGLSAKPESHLLTFSQRLANYYFEHFVPARFADKILQRAAARGSAIGFVLKDERDLGWVLKIGDGSLIVERMMPGARPPQICFSLTGQTMIKLIASRIPLSRALLLREVEVKGPWLDVLRVSQILQKFLKQHPISEEEISIFLEETSQ